MLVSRQGGWDARSKQGRLLFVCKTSDTGLSGCPGAAENMDMQPGCARGEVCASAAEDVPLLGWSCTSRLVGRLLLPAGLLTPCGGKTLPSGFRPLLLLPQLHHRALLGLLVVASMSLSPFVLKLLESVRLLPTGGLLSGSETSAWLGRRPLSDLPWVVNDPPWLAVERAGCSWVALGLLLLKKLRRLLLGWSSSVKLASVRDLLLRSK